MKIIHKKNKIIGKVLEIQTYKENISYRYLNFVVRYNIENNILLYNVLTREMVSLSDDEINKDESIRDFLIKNWFLVPADFDDIKFESQIKGMIGLFERKSQSVNGFTVLTTTKCNARCYYCFERGRSTINMSHETAIATADFIIRQSKGKDVHIGWFGGEPLYNAEVMDTICSILDRNSIKYTCSIVSNGYLFNQENVEKAIKQWNIRKAQITLDGTSKIYNRSKSYIYKDDLNPFNTVMKNIRRLLEAGIKVSIRLNVSKFNAEDLCDLVDELGREFHNTSNLTVYSHALFELAGFQKKKESDQYHAELYLQRKKIEEKIQQYGLSERSLISGSLLMNRCMSDSSISYVILPDGHLGKCEHYTDSRFVGEIYNDTIHQESLCQFKERVPDFPECRECPSHPDCINLKVCEESTLCFPERRKESLDKIKRQMLNTYEEYKQNTLKNTEGNEAEIQDTSTESC